MKIDSDLNENKQTIFSSNNLKKKELILHPLSEEMLEYNNYKKKTDKIFNDPKYYFTTTHEGNEIIIGKKLSKIKFHNHIPLFQTRVQKKSILLKNRSSILKSFSAMSTSSRANNNNNNHQKLKINQKYIDNEGLKKIYDSFKKLKLNNLPYSNSSKKLLKDDNYKIKNKLIQKFKCQEKTLHNFFLENKSKNKLIAKIMKKTKKKDKNDVLINSINSYRIKKEFIDVLDNEIRNSCINPIFGWQTSLRYSEKGDLQYHINVGQKTPNWQLYPLKPLEKDKEIIRNPNLDKTIYNSKSLKTYFNNNYLEKKYPQSYAYFNSINNENENKMKVIFSRNKKGDNLLDENENRTDFQNLCIKGEDLLSFETENSKLLKGRKILNTNNNNRFEEINNILVSELIDSPPTIKTSLSDLNIFKYN